MAYAPAHEGLRGLLERCRRAVEENPRDPTARNALATFLLDQGELGDALAAVDETLALQGDFIPALLTRGSILKAAGQLEAALRQYQRVLELRRDDPDALAQIADLLRLDGQIDQSIELSRRVVQANPNCAEAHHTLANALMTRGDLGGAIESFGRAIAIRPTHAEHYHNLAMALIAVNLIEDALAAFRMAIHHRPLFAEALANAAGLLRDQGELEKSIEMYRQAVALKPYLAVAHSNLVYALHLSPQYAAKAIFDEHVKWAQVHAEPLAKAIRAHENNRDPERRLRVGYVSPDFRDHSVARFVVPLLKAHDREQFEIHCFSTSVRPADEFTQQIRTLAGAFHDVGRLSHEQLANLIRSHRIDILVDLSGHTAHNRLLVFARKPAPVQFTYLGYPGTTGLSPMDYRITDALADPNDAHHTERLVRLPNGFLCYSPSVAFPAIGELPAARNGYVTFGSFNNYSKVTPEMIASWVRILRAVPTAKLVIKSTVLVDPATRAKIAARLIEQGMPGDRVSLVGPIPDLQDHLSAYNQIDIALDTFPYNGTTTTCEALVMGVGVVTLAGETHASRMGLDILTRIGMTELIGTSYDEYERTAVALAAETGKLAQWRDELRSRLERSPLMNSSLITRDLESAYRVVWRAWCAL